MRVRLVPTGPIGADTRTMGLAGLRLCVRQWLGMVNAPLPEIAFWFEFASTYSYPAAMRIERAATAHGCQVSWHPFLLGPIFRAQGWETSPFNLYPAKGRYMWRDLERICDALEIPLRRPSVFPRNGLLAARVACAALGQAWLPAYVCNVYRANFVDDRDIADPAVLSDCLKGLASDPSLLLRAAGDDAIKARLRSQTQRAGELGIFGAPSFVAFGELFWGNDRLEAALRWAAHARRSPDEPPTPAGPS